LNRLTRALAAVVRERLLDEKWLLAPSRRVGYQWIDAVTRSGQPSVNIRVRTIKAMALDLAAPEMARRGVTLPPAGAGELVVERVWRRVGSGGYLSSLSPGRNLFAALDGAVSTLRLAGLAPKHLRPRSFEVRAKGAELAALMTGYVEELAASGHVDYAKALSMAAGRLRLDADSLPSGLVVLVAEDAEVEPMERALLDAMPKGVLVELPVDRPGAPPEEPDEALACPCGSRRGRQADGALLRWLQSPADAPAASGDGTAEIFRAVGEANEVREVLRRCLARGWAFDEVELLHTDTETYVPLVYEIAHALGGASGEREDALRLPVTFADGIPVRYSRPGKALAAWLTWIGDDHTQATLVRMIRDGLVAPPAALAPSAADAAGVGFGRLADALASVEISFGRERYLARLDRQIAALSRRVRAGSVARDEDGETDDDRVRQLRVRRDELGIVRDLVAALVDTAPGSGSTFAQVLHGALGFIETIARRVDELDNLAAGEMSDRIKALADLIEGEEGASGSGTAAEALEWLAALPDEARVGGSGPRPGHLHVAHALAGGHSGRPHTFVVGLDDTRFPGAGLQDPLLLDSERRKLSPGLRIAGEAIREKESRFAGLMARLRGTVTLSYSCANLADDREMFPSPAIVAAFRILSGMREGDQGDLNRWLAPPASFAPEEAAGCLDETEWWLRRMTGPVEVANRREALAARFPHLAHGERAGELRRGAALTEFDGLVPEAGGLLDPARPEGAVMSASSLETVGRCPLAYFFGYALEIEPPEEPAVEPGRWLDPATFGTLLHAVFRDFVAEIMKRGERPERKRHADLLREILDRHVAECREDIPPPSAEALGAALKDLGRTAGIFLDEEEILCRTSGPEYVEASIGLAPEGEGSTLDTPEPVRLALPGGGAVRLRGRIDRIDRLDAPGETYAVWDYKTGSPYGYSRSDPFRQGRRVQHAVYLAVAGARLAEAVSKDAKVTTFGFFFPRPKGLGERIVYAPEDLAEGPGVIERLCRIVASGCFLATDDPNDCTFCDYTEVCRDLAAVAAASAKKLAAEGNDALAPFRDLRGCERDTDDEEEG